MLLDNTTTEGYIPRGSLMKAHGVLMLLAWILIFAVSFLIILSKDEDTKKKWWFWTIRALSIMAIVIMVIGIFLIVIANKDNSPPGLISSTYGMNVAHAVIGFITPLTVVAYLLLFHFIFQPNCTRKWPLFTAAFSFALFLCAAYAFVVFNVIFGLVLFQTGSAPVNTLFDNLPFVVFVFYLSFIHLLAVLTKMVLFIAVCCCAFCSTRCSCCYRASQCIRNKRRSFVWTFYMFCVIFTVVMMLLVMSFIIVSPDLGYIN